MVAKKKIKKFTKSKIDKTFVKSQRVFGWREILLLLFFLMLLVLICWGIYFVGFYKPTNEFLGLSNRAKEFILSQRKNSVSKWNDVDIGDSTDESDPDVENDFTLVKNDCVFFGTYFKLKYEKVQLVEGKCVYAAAIENLRANLSITVARRKPSFDLSAIPGVVLRAKNTDLYQQNAVEFTEYDEAKQFFTSSEVVTFLKKGDILVTISIFNLSRVDSSIYTQIELIVEHLDFKI